MCGRYRLEVPFREIVRLCGTFAMGTAKELFIDWAEKHPEKWSDDPALSITTLIEAAWPCPEAQVPTP